MKKDVMVTHLRVGDVVTFSFDLSSRRNIPVSPKILRIREDLEWDEVVLSSAASEGRHLSGILFYLFYFFEN